MILSRPSRSFFETLINNLKHKMVISCLKSADLVPCLLYINKHSYKKIEQICEILLIS